MEKPLLLLLSASTCSIRVRLNSKTIMILTDLRKKKQEVSQSTQPPLSTKPKLGIMVMLIAQVMLITSRT